MSHYDIIEVEFHDRATPAAAVAAVLGPLIVGAACGLRPHDTIYLYPDSINWRRQYGASSHLNLELVPVVDEDVDEEAEDAADEDLYRFKRALQIAARLAPGVIGRCEEGEDELGQGPILSLDDFYGDDYADPVLWDAGVWRVIADVLLLLHRKKWLLYDVVDEMDPDCPTTVVLPVARLPVGNFDPATPLMERLRAVGEQAASRVQVKPARSTGGFDSAAPAPGVGEACALMRLYDTLSVVFGTPADVLFRLRPRGRELINQMLARADLDPLDRLCLQASDPFETVLGEVLAGLLIDPGAPDPMHRFRGGSRLLWAMVLSGEAGARIRARIYRAETMEAMKGIWRQGFPPTCRHWEGFRFPNLYFQEAPS